MVITACAGVLEAIRRWLIEPIREILERSRIRDEDYYGTPARPGVPARPGIMQRLQTIDAQVNNNGGSSMKDAVDRVELGMADLRVDRQQVADSLVTWQDKIERTQRTLASDLDDWKAELGRRIDEIDKHISA
jgi:HAMP domain-containing protein